MDKKLNEFVESRIEVTCGAGLVFSGVLKAVNDDFVEIVDDHDDVTVVSIDKIIAVRKSADPTSRPGFIV